MALLYSILKLERSNPRFEAHFNCVLLDKSYLPTPSPFYDGKPVKNQLLKLKVLEENTEIGTVYDRVSISIQNSEPLLVVSGTMKKILQPFADELEFHPIDLMVENKKAINLYVVNVLNAIDAINYDRSKLIYWDLEHTLVYNIDELELDHEKLAHKPNIFLLGNFKGVVIIVSEAFKQLIEESDVKGFKFIPPEEFMI